MTIELERGELARRTRREILERFRPHRGSRFERYVAAIERVEAAGLGNGELELLAEAEHQCTMACDAAAVFPPSAPWSSRLADSLGGLELPGLEPDNDPSRDALFEVWVASRLQAAGFELTRPDQFDAVVKVGGLTLGVEVKRLQSARSLEKQVRKAAQQLADHHRAGLIVIDLSFAIGQWPHGFWRLRTTEDKPTVRDRLKAEVLASAPEVARYLVSKEHVIGVVLIAFATMYVEQGRLVGLARMSQCLDFERDAHSRRAFNDLVGRTFVSRFMWDVEISPDELRQRLRATDLEIRAQWQGALLREARFEEIWSYTTLSEVLSNWERVRRHLGRRRAFWDWLLEGWRRDGFLAR